MKEYWRAGYLEEKSAALLADAMVARLDIERVAKLVDRLAEMKVTWMVAGMAAPTVEL